MSIEMQLNLEEQYSRKNIRKHVLTDIDKDCAEFLDSIEYVQQLLAGDYYHSKNKRLAACKLKPEDIVTEVCAAVLLTGELVPFQSVASKLAAVLDYDNLLDGVKTASEVLAVCEPAGLYTLYHANALGNYTGTLGIRANFILSKEVTDFIEQTMYLPPMVTPPKKWTNNTDGGYISIKKSVILGKMNHHTKCQSLDAINIIQQIPWELNTELVQIEETPNKHLDTDEKIQQFTLMKEQSRNVYNLMLSLGNKFYFTWRNDKRGRMYSQGYHINLQSTEYKKAILQFANKEQVTL